jgi:hypothetical protein
MIERTPLGPIAPSLRAHSQPNTNLILPTLRRVAIILHEVCILLHLIGRVSDQRRMGPGSAHGANLYPTDFEKLQRAFLSQEKVWYDCNLSHCSRDRTLDGNRGESGVLSEIS